MVVKPLMLDETGKKIAEALMNLGALTDEQAERFLNKWLDKHPEATTTVRDGSLTAEKFTEDLKRRTIKDNMTPQMYGAVGDGVTDDTQALQDYADDCNDNQYSSMYIPTQKEDYYITSPVVVTEPGIRVYGEKAATYNRGNGKKGNIIIGGDATHGLDLGGGRTSQTATNTADTFTVENIGLSAVSKDYTRQKNGIVISSQTNGPDRGIWLNQISANLLGAGVYIPPANEGVSIQAACLNIERCVLSSNNVAVLNDGKVYCFRFVGNQCEQNIEHAIKGSFCGAIVISDNMLEGQKNAICITGASGDIKLVSERNYFEANHINGSEYVYMLGNNAYYSKNSATIRNNFTSGAENPPDVIRLTGKGNWKMILGDGHPVTLYECAASITHGSEIFSDKADYYSIRSLGTRCSTTIYVNNGVNLLDVNNTHDIVSFTAENGTQKMTPFGRKYVANGLGSPIDIPTSAAKDDLIVMNVLLRSKKNSWKAQAGKTITIYNSAGNYVTNGIPCGIMDNSFGEWSLVSIPFVNPGNLSNGFRVSFGTQDEDEELDIAGIAVKNYGYFADDGTTKVDVRPVCPVL